MVQNQLLKDNLGKTKTALAYRHQQHLFLDI
jgi:hypothetical protein